MKLENLALVLVIVVVGGVIGVRRTIRRIVHVEIGRTIEAKCKY